MRPRTARAPRGQSIVDMADAVVEKRLAPVALVFDRLLPKGYARDAQHEYTFRATPPSTPASAPTPARPPS